MHKIYVTLLSTFLLSFVFTPIFSQSPACANFSGVFISDSLEQNFPEYYICNGSTFYLKSLSSPVGATYQWKQNGVNLVGETNRKLLIQDRGIFSLTMTIGGCTATSSGIVIGIGSILPTNSINSNGITQTCIGDTINLSAPKGIGFSYQWFKNNVLITTALSSTYKAIETGSYKVTITRGSVCMTTMNTLSLNFGNSANPIISTNKSVICQGRKTTLKSSNINATHTLQWFKDGVAISSANKDSLVVNQTGNYYLQTTKGSCTGNSNALNISITNLNLPAPQIQKAHLNAYETCANNIVKLKVIDYNDSTMVWLKDGNVLAGQTGTSLIARESGNYAVRYSGNELCFSQSDVIPVKITDVSSATFSPNSITASSYDFQSFNPTFTGSAPYIYSVNTTRTDIVTDPNTYSFFSNLNSPTLTITKIANACGVGTANGSATITLGSCSTPTQITSISASNNPVCIGGSAILNAAAQGTGTLTYQWRKDGVNISGATSNSLVLSNFNYTDIAKYSIAVTGGCGTVISNRAIILNANYGDVVFAKLDYPAYTNSDILLTAFSGSSFGNASNAYRWAGPNGFTSTEQNPVIPNGTALNSGTYTVTATNAGGCINYALLNVTVTSAPITLGNLGTTSFCPNGTLSVPFTTTLAIGTLYKVYLSDANGSFRNQTEIGNGMTSPINITFPGDAQSGTRYRIIIVARSPLATSIMSGYLNTDGRVLTISVKNLIGREINGGDICAGSALTGIINGNQLGVSYEWKRNGILQTTNQSLRMIQTGTYAASVQKPGCSKTTQTISLRFTQSPENVISRLGYKYQCDGVGIIFKNSYFSDSANYQWKRNNNNLVGQIQDSLIATQTGIYTCDITDKCNISFTTIEDLNSVMFSNTLDAKIIPGQSINGTTLCGSNTRVELLCISDRITNPLAPYSYQWKKDVTPIPNENGRIITVRQSGVYNLAFKQGNCSVNSNGILVNKVDTIKLLLKPEYSLTEICQGMQTNLFSYIPWGINAKGYKDGVLFSNYPFSYFNVNETGRYHLNGTALGCIVLPSDTIKVTVGNKLQYKISNSKPVLCNGQNGEITAYIGSLVYPYVSFTYQWFRNNQPISGQTRNFLQTNLPGFYKVRMTSGVCTGFSDSVEVKITNQLPKPIVDVEFVSGASSFCVDNVITMITKSDKRNNFVVYNSFQWKKNGILFANTPSVLISQPGTYTVIGKQGTCETESDPVEIKIGEPITANITGSTSIYPGQKAKLNLNFTGGNAWSYQTSDMATGQTTSLSPTLKNVGPSSTQTYSITSIASNCGVGTVTGNATVTVLPCPSDKTFSINSGNWNVPATWTCGQIPTPVHDAIIEKDHTVSLPNSYQGETKKLDLKGTLKQGVGSGVRVY